MKRMILIMFLMMMYSSQYVRENSTITLPLNSKECSESPAHKKPDDSLLTQETEDTIAGDDAGMMENDAAITSGSDHKYLNRFILVE